MRKKQANPIDIQVGNRVRIRRMLIGMSQERLGDLLGLTFQQVQKYENGTNRVGSGRLARIARVLDVPIARFFVNRSTGEEGVAEGDTVTDLLSSPYALRMLRAINNIPDDKVRLSLVTLTESLAKH